MADGQDSGLSAQDVADLQIVRSKLPKGDERIGKIDSLLQQNIAQRNSQQSQIEKNAPQKVDIGIGRGAKWLSPGEAQGPSGELQPTNPLIDTAVTMGSAALPLGVEGAMGAISRSVPWIASNPAATRLIGGTLGAAGGAGLGAMSGMEAGGHPVIGALSGAVGGGFGGERAGRAIASTAEEAMASRLGLPSKLEKAARSEALMQGRLSPYPWRQAANQIEQSATEDQQLPWASRVFKGGQEPLVLTPEEAAAQERLQGISAKLAKERGMQYAGGVRTAGPNRAANRLFPWSRSPE